MQRRSSAEGLRQTNVARSHTVQACALSKRSRLVVAIGLALTLPSVAMAQDINLGSLGSDGFAIEGTTEGDFSGESVSGAGDVNGDGLADLIVGAFGAAPNGEVRAGSSYVVFGKPGDKTAHLESLGDGGFVIEGAAAYDASGRSVSGAGDVNGDGLTDLIVGAPGVGDSGLSYVVFGKLDNEPVDLGALGSDGFAIIGASAGDGLGNSVSGAGDVNGDGLSDLIVGASHADPGDEEFAGSSYVVFGKAGTETVDLAVLGDGGFVIEGALERGNSGNSVSGAGDVNGDGLADLIVGAWRADVGSKRSAGTSSSYSASQIASR